MIGAHLILLVKNMSSTPDAVPARRACAGLIIHAPTTLDSRVRGTYESLLPDGQKEVLEWDDGQKKTQYYDGTFPGKCDTVVSANKLLMASGAHVDWDLHDMSEPGNDIGHGRLPGDLGQDNLGQPTCSARIYSLLLRNTPNSVGDLVVGGAASDRWSGFLVAGATLRLPPNSIFVLACEGNEGMAVGSGNSNLKMDAVGGDIEYGLNMNSCSV